MEQKKKLEADRKFCKGNLYKINNLCRKVFIFSSVQDMIVIWALDFQERNDPGVVKFSSGLGGVFEFLIRHPKVPGDVLISVCNF